MNLQTIDNFTRKLGPVSTLIDAVMEAILPKVVASACAYPCSGTWQGDYCYTVCENCIQYAVYHTMAVFAQEPNGSCDFTCSMGCSWKVAGGPCGDPGPC
jgi:hypothetical protein